jgi:two-component system chemotaxis response regulator CheB
MRFDVERSASHRDIIVVGASAGGVPALQQLCGGLPADLEATVLIVMHIPVYATTSLDSILGRAGPLPTKLANDGDRLKPGSIFIAPNDHHLLIDNQRLRLTRGPRENRVRPCVDVLFRSAALAGGPRVIGVILSGSLDDGTAGLWAIKDRGGLSIVQQPEDAEYPAMPQNAFKHVTIDYTVAATRMGPLLAQLTREPLATKVESLPPESMALETKIAIEGNALKQGVMEIGELSKNTCPECHGVLVKIREGSIVRFRCHTGHAFSLQTLLADTDKAIEASLWSSIRAIEERALILREMEATAEAERQDGRAKALSLHAQQAERSAQTVRDLLVKDDCAVRQRIGDSGH